MTTSVSSILWRAYDTTENYNWIKAMSDAFDAVGFALHTDTGQINLSGTTVALPATPSSNTHYSAGYQIRKLVSAGKQTIYCKIDYGIRRGSGGTTTFFNVPSILMAIGTDTTGSGTLSGVTMASPLFTANGNYGASSTPPSTLTRPLYISSDGQNYLTAVCDPGLNNISSRANSIVPLSWCVERTISAATLAYDNEGVLWVLGSNEAPTGVAATNMCWLNFVGGHTIASTGANIPCQAPPYYTSSAGAGNSHLFPITVCIPAIKGPMKSALFYYTTDITDGTFMTTSLYGETHTFVAGGSLQQANAVQSIAALKLAFRQD